MKNNDTADSAPVSWENPVVKLDGAQKKFVSAAPLPDIVPSSWTVVPALKNTPRIGKYDLIAKLGEGGMGTVYKARHIHSKQIVAIKLLAKDISKDKVFVARFIQEAQNAARLNHENIVRGLDFGQDDRTGIYYLAMEFVDGITLGQALIRNGPLSEEQAIRVGLCMARALACAEELKIVHRDIKPDNILLSKNGAIKLADLGLAQQIGVDGTLTQTGSVVGTPYYIAPEQARGNREEVDGLSDMYALGATLFHLVTGRPPYEGETAPVIMLKHLNNQIPLACKFNNKISDTFSRVLAKMMQKQKSLRFANAQELVEAFEALNRGEIPGSLRTQRDKIITPSHRRTRLQRRKSEPVQHSTAIRPLINRNEYVLPAAAGMAILLLGGLALTFFGKNQKTQAQPQTPAAASVLAGFVDKSKARNDASTTTKTLFSTDFENYANLKFDRMERFTFVEDQKAPSGRMVWRIDKQLDLYLPGVKINRYAQYRIAFWIRSEGRWDELNFYVKDAKVGGIGHLDQAAWRHVNIEFLAPRSDSLRLLFKPSNATIYLDDLQIVRLNEPADGSSR